MAILMTIWKNKRHFKLQIFGVTVMFVVLVFILNLITIVVAHRNKINDYLKSNSQYTVNFQTSLSNVSGTVSKIYTDKSRTQCFTLVNFENFANLTMNANKYEILITDVNEDGKRTGVPKEKITGEIYMFGSTGIVGLYLKSDKPFTSHMKQLTLRSYAKVSNATTPHVMLSSSDAEYDQCHIFFNPGASDAKTIDFLETHVTGTPFDLTEIYRQVGTVSDEIKLRTDILQFYTDLKTTMNQIMEYGARLNTSYDINVPELPEFIAGDKFEDANICDSNNNVVDKYSKFVPATIVPGGTDFDWYVGSVRKGYYNLVPNANNMSIKEYMSSLKSSQNVAVDNCKILNWTYKDGTPVVTKGSNLTTYEKNMISNMDLYNSAISEYLRLKTAYQREQLSGLLFLEMDSGSMGKAYTIRSDENTVRLY